MPVTSKTDKRLPPLLLVLTKYFENFGSGNSNTTDLKTNVRVNERVFRDILQFL